MKFKTLVLTLLTMASVTTSVAVYGQRTEQGLWARQYIEPMEQAKMIPQRCGEDHTYTNTMSREAFAELLIQYVHAGDIDTTKKLSSKNSFEDTNNPLIVEAYRLGIVEGVTDTEFKPQDSLTRAQAVTMIHRMIKKLDPSVEDNSINKKYVDSKKIPDWAEEAIYSSLCKGVFSGFEDGSFGPEMFLTEEQGIKAVAVLAHEKQLIELTPEKYPNVTFEFSKDTLYQGDSLEYSVGHYLEGDKPFIKQGIYSAFKLYGNSTNSVGLVPTNYSTPPGTYWVEYGIEGFTPQTKMITVLPASYKVQKLTVSKSVVASTKNDAAYAEYDKYFKPVRKQSHSDKYYTEPFVLPVSGRLSTEFGEMRSVNGAITSYRHSGLDIAAPADTPIQAANRGKVVLSMYLTLTGNTIVIDHGQGVFSVYFHMSKRLIENGAMVERGALIGKVGSTGFSTGPHLHFTMSYYDMNIEPGFFIYGKSVTKENYKVLFNIK